jgi:hypothetical protein
MTQGKYIVNKAQGKYVVNKAQDKHIVNKAKSKFKKKWIFSVIVYFLLNLADMKNL